ncbi:MAG: sulfite exporter TauE/SafE family protein [Oscillospiraceae bacterium]|nr:sulfite exporter TauE/SafE family protein [Oscillospiraceae bacterium]
MVYWIIAAITAFFVKGLCSFGSALVFTSILSFGNDNISISPVELLLVLPSNIIMAWKERKEIKWKVCLPLAILVLCGSIPGILLLRNANAQAIKMFFGFTIVAIGIEMFLRESKNSKSNGSKLIRGIVGLLSGALCGLFGTGALLAAYVGRTTDTTKSFRGNLCLVLLADNLFRLVLYTVTGIITLEAVKTAAILSPFMLIGVGVGILLSKVLNEKVMKKIVIVMLIISGISLIITNAI